MFDEARPVLTPLMQDPAFAHALHLCGQRPMFLPDGLMMLHRRIAGVRLLMLPRAAPPHDLAAQLRSIGLHRTPLILSPETPCPMPRSLRLRKGGDRAVLDLTGSDEDRRAALHPKWRNQLKRGEKAGLMITRKPLPADPDTAILRQELRQAQQRGYANWPPPLTASFAAAAPRQTHVFRAHHKGRVVAHMLFLTHGACATYHLGHITDTGKALSAHNLLLWRACRYFAKRGAAQLDLGVLSDETPALNRFKLRCGATRRATGGTHLYWRPFARG
ncbi:GNAT family N-acetyltransferase [Sulfitobacter geojensis]|uniref:GNAT family N-acetyltransferase n=1 Tax=Sulfitobacter geojensis TaxID=1342299 RepID=UPI0007D9850A|nr:GNAT family N-acetyltransferase [Sulfitobacter geojensis]OAN98114.1 hypothetical protein A8B74_01905 [Sulfitobacter geojensis]